MGSVTATVVPGEGYVRAEVNWQDFPHARRVWIWRTVNGVDTLLRDGDYAWLSNGIAVAFDHEAPVDVPVGYKSTIPLNWNGDFASGVTEWQDSTNGGTIGTVTQSLDYYAPGAGNASLRLVPSGAAAAKAVSEFIPVTVGTAYTLTGRLMVDGLWAGGIRLQIQWFNGTTVLSNSQGADDFSPFPGTWGSYSVIGVAPATATQCRIAAVITGTPPAALRLFAAELYLTVAVGTVSSANVLVPSNGGGWWTDPLHPATKQRLQVDLQTLAGGQLAGLVYLGVGEESFPADSTILDVNDAVLPVGAFQRRKGGRQEIRVGTGTLADLAALKALHASGAPLLLQMTAAYGEAPAYQLHGDLATPRVHGDQKVPWRIGMSQFVKVAAPVGPAEGTLRTRYVDLVKYPTFWQAQSAGGVYDDFQRAVAGGFGVSTNGRTYALTGTAADYSVTGSRAAMSLGSTGVERIASVSNIGPDVDVVVYFVPTVVAVGAQAEQKVRVRHNGVTWYETNVQYQTDGTIVLYLVRGVTVLSGLAAFMTYNASTVVGVHLRVVGLTVQHKAWDATVSVEPAAWAATVTDAVVPGNTTDAVQLVGSRVGGNTNAGLVVQLDDLMITNLVAGGAATWLDALRGSLAS